MNNYTIHTISNRTPKYACTIALPDSIIRDIRHNERYYNEGFFLTEKDIKKIISLDPEYYSTLSELNEKNKDIIIDPDPS